MKRFHCSCTSCSCCCCYYYYYCYCFYYYYHYCYCFIVILKFLLLFLVLSMLYLYFLVNITVVFCLHIMCDVNVVARIFFFSPFFLLVNDLHFRFHHCNHHFHFIFINTISHWGRIQRMNSSSMVCPYSLIMIIDR